MMMSFNGSPKLFHSDKNVIGNFSGKRRNYRTNFDFRICKSATRVFVSTLLYNSETWKKKEKSKIKAVQMDNL